MLSEFLVSEWGKRDHKRKYLGVIEDQETLVEEVLSLVLVTPQNSLSLK